VHIDEYLLEVRDTKRGLEELTSDIPNVSEEATRNLDENGLIRIGAHVEPGDILIGKITRKENLILHQKKSFYEQFSEIKPAMLKMLRLKHLHHFMEL